MYGQGLGPILLDDVFCSGIEQSLLDCQYRFDDSNCGHHQDVGIECRPGMIEQVNTCIFIITTCSLTCANCTSAASIARRAF